jgi:hypothetical protein
MFRRLREARRYAWNKWRTRCVDPIVMADGSARRPLWLLVGFWACVVIAIAVVIRRAAALARPSSAGPPAMQQLDTAFASHAALTLAHIIPAAIFVVLAAILMFRPASGTWLQRVFFATGAITSVTAYAMNAFAIGGWIERSAVLVFNTWFLFSLGCAAWFCARRENQKQRKWTTRAVGILLGIATTRPVMGVFFATSPLTHLQPSQFFGIAFWIGFSINSMAVELWLRSKRRRKVAERQYAAVSG